MKRYSLTSVLKISAAILLGFCATSSAQELEGEGPRVRILKNVDGSSTQFKRDHKNTRLEQTSYLEKNNGEKIIRTRTVYRRDKNGRLRSGVIEDGQRVKLYRIIYGYHKDTGRLIAENMYDARVIRRNDPKDPTKETPVRALRYSYTAQGKRSKPMVFVGVYGKTAKELKKWLKENKFEKNGTYPTRDPFRNVPVNPSGTPLRRN